MKNRILLLIICLIFSNIIVSQEYFYYYGGNKIPLKLNTDYIYVSAEINKRLPSVGNTKHINVDTIDESYLNRIKGVSNTQVRHNASINLGSNLSEKEYFEIISNLTKNEDVIVAPSFDLDGDRLELSEYFYVCLKQLSDTILLFNKSMETNVRIVAQDQFMENWFTLAVTEDSHLNSLEAANVFYESGLFKYAEPDFRMENPLLSNDPEFSQQWGLKNTGQNGGIAGMDINVEPAWNYSTGEGIVVAVIDEGIYLDHPDLRDNIYHISYDIETDTLPSDIHGDHGTYCAGVIGAVKDNNIGVAGIAPDCKLMSISIDFDLPQVNRKIAAGINWAWMNGADILNNSYETVESAFIDDAIMNAVNNGRNGLGCPVLFASGNNNASSVSYPASLPNTIAVGAINQYGERKSPTSLDNDEYWDGGSNYGVGIDIVAPGVYIPTTEYWGYYDRFNGTSSACPHAAGVMALILSANPCLTQEEAREILCKSCDKLSNCIKSYNYSNNEYGLWNNEIGYGKINAHTAVKMAISSDISYNIISTNVSMVETLSETEVCAELSGIATGVYYVDKYEVTRNITFQYTENPVIIGYTNGYSDDNPNDGTNFFSVSNLTNTSATLKTWCYYVRYNTLGQTINKYYPTSPSNVYFDIKVIEPSINRTISNHQLTSGNYDYAAFDTISTAIFSVTGNANVNLHAGESVLLLDGTFISPDQNGSFEAYIEPFNPCSSNQNKRGSYDGKNNRDDSYQDNLSVEEEDYLEDLTDEETISVFPNPNRGSFNVLLYNTEDEIQKVVVYDMMGNIVYSDETFKGGEINLPDISSGMYHLTIILNKQIIKKKIIIQ